MELLICIFIFVFNNENVEADTGILPVVSQVSETVNKVAQINNLQLPVNSPLPPLGTTACSTYPSATQGVANFPKKCYTQLFAQPYADFPFKCRYSQFFLGLEAVPFQLPAITDFTPQVGYIIINSRNMYNISEKLDYNYTFAEYETAQQIFFLPNTLSATFTATGVITLFNDKGFVYLQCPLIDLQQPICATPQYIEVCTYAQFPPATDVKTLADPLNVYPYYFGNSLVAMDQSECPAD